MANNVKSMLCLLFFFFFPEDYSIENSLFLNLYCASFTILTSCFLTVILTEISFAQQGNTELCKLAFMTCTDQQNILVFQRIYFLESKVTRYLRAQILLCLSSAEKEFRTSPCHWPVSKFLKCKAYTAGEWSTLIQTN